jgi:2-oxoglutarate ferredoxin oxidoreductase subunit gamma
MVLNIVMVGFFGAVTGLISRESLRKAVEDSVPAAFREMNQKAFDVGYEHGLKHLKQGELRADELQEEVEVRE